MDDQEQQNFIEKPNVPKSNEGKDELNLAEFPLSAIADRLHPDQKTMVFEDKVWDTSQNEMVTRQLTITAADQYGLPTALDDEVILGLVQLSKIQNFADRKVHFTRYQLIQLLGWTDEGRNYDRLEKSLNRWVGVTLYYKNAWWSREQQCWVNEKFHILDNVTIYDREAAKGLHPAQQVPLALSNFVWNDVLFRSFKAGNLKSIDFDFFVSLKSPISKRLYRFLDKRFYQRKRWEFDLNEFSFEHVGLSRNYDAANLKRKLRPAIEELERTGFLKPMSDEARFKKVRAAEWRVVFEKASEQLPPAYAPSAPANAAEALVAGGGAGDPIVQALVQRGITPSVAAELVANYPLERITAQLEVFDWLVEQKNANVSRNPAGFLVISIRSEYAPPKGFLKPEERDRRVKEAAERRRKAEEKKHQAQEREKAKEEAREQAIQRFWDSLSEDERQKQEEQALSQATDFDRDLIHKGGALGAAARKNLLDTFALLMMSQG
jgi:plasmid replication initiation protein